MFGYACDEMLELMPLPIMTLPRSSRSLKYVRPALLISCDPIPRAKRFNTKTDSLNESMLRCYHTAC